MAGFLADVTVGVHFAALLYIGLGGFLAWRWPRSIFVHLVFSACRVAVNVFAAAVPVHRGGGLFPGQQGLGPLPGGFNEYYIYDELIPRSLLPVVAVGAIVALVVSYVGVWVRWRRSQLMTAS